MPQHPAEGSEWMKLWPDQEQQKKWLNRIANLIPLTRQRNSAAQNYDFDKKKTKYFQSKDGVSSFALASQVISTKEWTPEVVEQRQKDLMDVFIREWDLAENPDAIESPDFMLAGRGADAVGRFVPGGKDEKFIVKKGSRIASNISPGLQQVYIDRRQQLIKDDVIHGNKFIKDYTFDSPSAAATIVLGRSANGRREWAKDDGRTVAQAGH